MTLWTRTGCSVIVAKAALPRPSMESPARDPSSVEEKAESERGGRGERMLTARMRPVQEPNSCKLSKDIPSTSPLASEDMRQEFDAIKTKADL